MRGVKKEFDEAKLRFAAAEVCRINLLPRIFGYTGTLMLLCCFFTEYLAINIWKLDQQGLDIVFFLIKERQLWGTPLHRAHGSNVGGGLGAQPRTRL